MGIDMQRRSFLSSTAAFGLLGVAGCATTSIPTSARVVVIGGGYGGATAAKYVRMLSDNKIDVVLVEPNSAFVSCPISNLVIGGSQKMADITTPYTGLSRNHGVTVVKDVAKSIDTTKKVVTLGGGQTIRYDKLVVSPSVDLMFGGVAGRAAGRQHVRHAGAGMESQQPGQGRRCPHRCPAFRMGTESGTHAHEHLLQLRGRSQGRARCQRALLRSCGADKTVAGSGGLSLEPTELEGVYAKNWARNIWADMLT